jgi:hypothetical protein
MVARPQALVLSGRSPSHDSVRGRDAAQRQMLLAVAPTHIRADAHGGRFLNDGAASDTHAIVAAG